MNRSVLLVSLKCLPYDFGAPRHVEKLPGSHASLRSERPIDGADPVVAIKPVGGAADYRAVTEARHLWGVFSNEIAVRIVLRRRARRNHSDQRRPYHRSHFSPSYSVATVSLGSIPVTPKARRAG